MNFSLKRSCKNCHFDDNGDQGKCQAGVKTAHVQDAARKPVEPCYKPITNAHYKIHLDMMMPTLRADLEIHRLID